MTDTLQVNVDRRASEVDQSVLEETKVKLYRLSISDEETYEVVVLAAERLGAALGATAAEDLYEERIPSASDLKRCTPYSRSHPCTTAR